MIKITATEFLQELFSIAPTNPDRPVAWITTFKGAPKSGDWTGNAHDPSMPLPAIKNENAYYSVAAFKHGTRARRQSNKHLIVAVVCDDIGKTVPIDKCVGILGDPSFIVETSKGNYQYGYLLDKAMHPDALSPLLDALKEVGATDPSGNNSIRNVRLPTGINGKPGNGNFKVRLVGWHPKRRYSLEYFQQRLKVDPTKAKKKDPYTSPDVINGPTGHAGGERDAELTRYVGYLFATGMKESEVLEAARDRNVARNKPPLPDNDVPRIVKSVKKTHERGLEKGAKAEAQVDEGEEYRGVDPDAIEDLKALPLDIIVLPSDHFPYDVSARRMFSQMGKHRRLFIRADKIVRVNKGKRTLEIVTADIFRSTLDAAGRRVKSFAAHRTQLVLKSKRCSNDNAEVLLAAEVARECLPPIELVTRAAVLIEVGSELKALGPGYHPEGGGVMVFADSDPPDVPLATAVPALKFLLNDFQFKTEPDRSRAIANFIGPALRMGCLLKGHAMLDAKEADQSQTGKGYLLACMRAIYGEPGQNIAQTKGGVGSLDETIAAALFSGAPIITIDNARGRIESTYLEMLLTIRGEAPVRLPYKGSISIDIRRTTFHLTSNGYEATVDLGNRSMITRLIKQPEDYAFKAYPEGGLLEHIEANQSHYLGCIFAVIKAWHAAGKPRLPTAHTFREWVGTLDWIVQNIFKLPALLEGHEEAIERVTTPGLSWLRLMMEEVKRRGQLGRDFSASDLVSPIGVMKPGMIGVMEPLLGGRKRHPRGLKNGQVLGCWQVWI